MPLTPNAASSDRLESLVCVPGQYVCARWRNLTIVYWMQQATGPSVRRMRAITDEVAAAYPGGFSSIHLVRNGAPLPDGDTRQAFSDSLKKHAPQIACIGIVMMGAGFWASALQGMVTGFSMVAKRSYVLRFARQPAELCAWFPKEHQKRSGQVVEASELAAVMREIMQMGDRSESEPHLAAV